VRQGTAPAPLVGAVKKIVTPAGGKTHERRGSARFSDTFVDCGRAAIAQVPAPVIARTGDRMPFTVPLSETRRDRSLPQRALTHATPPRHAGHKRRGSLGLEIFLEAQRLRL